MHHTVAEVVRFVEERIKVEDEKDSRSLRGPYLARLELMHRLRERGYPEENLPGRAGRVVHLPAAAALHHTLLLRFKQASLLT